ncbi:Rad4 transglutaminase-like domain-containing protein [Colletotrichum orchidophilum]|uniref:Rad4 transglutaminase-like domain-containing protein n=1 Tax=Colletotrichum orchidophilum TaxID=1209926 RepID=A0A1G4AZE6_9PEZI|nr:Rad4 transglutaminase-like domain-containing protein [Colletotrichum orchidophilum]OHE94548.1 Rad4 transglutaminase-like domain-containing protein [Colletotrichum orchidophilum]
MAGRKRVRATRSRAANSDLPDVYQEMLVEAAADVGSAAFSEPPAKRLKRPGEGKAAAAAVKSNATEPEGSGDDDEDADIEFEDVVLPQATVQTLHRDSDDGDDDDFDDDVEEEVGNENGIIFEDVEFGALQPDLETREEPKRLTLNLSKHAGMTTASRKGVTKRKPVMKEEKERRISIHRTHLLCLLLHCALRNRWCDDEQVQKSLRPLLAKKTIGYLKPSSSLPPFGQTESLKNGLEQAGAVFRSKFQITERGLRRPLWAEDPDHLTNYEPPSDMDSCLDRSDFRGAARTLSGSRDTGAQLYCALLRAVGIRARLVCSLQPLSFGSAGPTLPKPRDPKSPKKLTNEEEIRTQLSQYNKPAVEETSSAASVLASPLHRSGHPNAAAYQLPSTSVTSLPRRPGETPKKIRESSFPVYWVEVLDVGHQKWQPVDPLVTNSIWKPKQLEPPATDKENSLTYVIAFDADGTVRDVTRRYAKAYTAKTRRLRIETAVERGDRWWRKVLKPFGRHQLTDLDQIEDNELNATEAREPMPRNVADFKDHPVFALERHLRRNEVFIPDAQPAGTVAAGSRAPLEKVYRRKDVRIARNRDKWYRMGREVKPMEVPVKFLPRRSNAKPGEYVDDGYGGDARNAAGIPIFTQDQTEIYRASPVVDGRIPKNKFGNIDVYVESMVPEGGVHILDEFDKAARAAYVLGIDYAPALSGFQFKGKHGTAVFNGVVVAKEYEEAVCAVMTGFEDVDAQAEQSKRSSTAIRTWRRFLVALQISERVWAGVEPEERAEEERKLTESVRSGVDKVSDDYSTAEGGGFLIEDSARIVDAAQTLSSATFMIKAEARDSTNGFGLEKRDKVATRNEDTGKGAARIEAEADGGGFLVDTDEEIHDNGAAKQTTEARVSPGIQQKGRLKAEEDSEVEDALSDVTEEYDMEEDEGGGGFLVG